jgi:hypothetical protein
VWESSGTGRIAVQRWCRFNASISARERRRRDKALLEDEVEAARACLGLVRRKCDTAQWRDNINRMRGGTGEG